MNDDRTILKTLVSADGEYRLQIFRRSDGLFGFNQDQRAQTYDGDPCWTPVWPSPDPICDSAETAEAEARNRIEWARQLGT